MARPREFDETTALEAAMNCFWAQGFEQTSVRDLAERMGITGASLYNAFGDKRSLYRQAFVHYLEQTVHDRVARLEKLPPLDHRTFLALASRARLIVSDSGGVQEECTVLKRPMLVVRNSTERPESIEAGFAQLVQPGEPMGDAARVLLDDPDSCERLAQVPCPFGDGTASQQITALLRRFLA